jgi:glycosyltransferase involved in cell wall biosynthesis
MYNPLVSIIVPCYNQAQYLDEALDSVLKQTYENWECFIVNDGSLDDTEAVAKKWLEKDSRFKYLFQENGGLGSARNLGLNNSNGAFIQFLDADDLLDSNKLMLSWNECKGGSSKDISIVVSNFRMFTDKIINSTIPFCQLKQDLFTFENMLFGWDYEFNIPIHCGFFDSLIFKDFRFPKEINAKEDWVMWLNVFFKKPIFYFLNVPLAYYRIHPESMTKDVTHMEKNHINAIVYLREIIPEDIYNEYLIYVLNKKSEQLVSLKLQIKKYKNSKSYKTLDKLKKNFILKYLIKLLK